MKVKISIIGDNDRAEFKALQDLILAEGYPVSITPVVDIKVAAPEKNYTRNVRKDVSVKEAIAAFLKEQGGRATRKAISTKLKSFGYSPTSAGPGISWLVKRDFAKREGKYVVLVKSLTQDDFERGALR